MRALTFLGNGWVVYWIVVLYLYRFDPRPFRESFLLLFLTQIIPGAVVDVLKRIVDRPRPIVALHRLIAEGRVHVVVLGRHLTAYSFPSGHAETAFALAVALGYLYPRRRAAFYILAALVAFSRVYNGEHFPLDVICGGLVGYAFGWIGIWAYRRVSRRAIGGLPTASEEA